MGMLVRSADAMQGIGFAMVIPLSFLAGTSRAHPGHGGGSRAIGQRDPISAFVAAIRQVCQGHEVDRFVATGTSGLRR